MQKNIITELITFLLIVLFTYAAITKLADYQKFSVQLAQSPLLSKFSTLLVFTIPALEIVISLLLAFSYTRLLGLYVAFILLVVFTAYIVYILLFSPHIPCSCGGVLEDLGWGEHVIFNLIFVFMASIAILQTVKHNNASRGLI